ncbi:FG-GAP-like repeat-containing protein [Streptomyces sp. NPDC058671]|uniref:FG-GAP-like repeat-containing protein n=1 Tax=Streptomyces sp. NPDC058671 TaxID=3346590 RepID=UPI003651CB6B
MPRAVFFSRPRRLLISFLVTLALAITSSITLMQRPAVAAEPHEVLDEVRHLIQTLREEARASERSTTGQSSGTASTSRTGSARSRPVQSDTIERVGFRRISLDALRVHTNMPSVEFVIQMSNMYVAGFYQVQSNGTRTFYQFRDDDPPTPPVVVDHHAFFGFTNVTNVRLPHTSSYAAMAGEDVWTQTISTYDLETSVGTLAYASPFSLNGLGRPLARLILTLVESARSETVYNHVVAGLETTGSWYVGDMERVIHNWADMSTALRENRAISVFMYTYWAFLTVNRLRSVLQIRHIPPKPGPSPFLGKVPRLAVMPLGDSITLGVGSTTRTGYRPEIAAQLADSAQQVEFVGSQVDPDGTHHEGHSGWRIDQIQAEIETWLAAAKPNVILLHIGTNDMNRDYQTGTAPQRLGRLLDQIRAASPDTAVVLATLVPATDPAVQARVDAYNQAIPQIVSSRAAQGQSIVQVSMGALTTADLNDNLHPNNAGYTKMAAAFNGGVRALVEKGGIKETVVVNPAPPKPTSNLGDHDVDLNGDGRADYLVVDANGATRAFLNTADATGKVKWTDQGYVATGSTQWTGGQVRFADVNGDGRADYLVVEPNGATRAFLNIADTTGKIKWTDQGVIATGSSYWTSDLIRFADINGDARADYLVLESNGATRAYVNTAHETGKVVWTDQGFIATGSSSWAPGQIRFADINADQRADYLVLEPNGATRAYLNTADPTGKIKWNDQGVVATGSTQWTADQVRFADINADQRADYLVIDAQGAIRAFLNTADATGKVKWTDQGVIATGAGAIGSSVRI